MIESLQKKRMGILGRIMKTVLVLLLVAPGNSHAQQRILMLVGTYTDGISRGMYSFSLDQVTGKVSVLDSLEMRNPSYLTVSSRYPVIYSVCETNDGSAALNTIYLDKSNGHMSLADHVLTDGEDPCYVADNGKIAVTANYSGGSMSVFNILKRGRKTKLTGLFKGSAGGPDVSRQQTPHIHCSCFTPDGKYILATDFSSDRILSFKVKGRKVDPNGVAARVSDGSGPRHLVFSRDGRFAYVMSELSGKVTAFAYQDGHLENLQEIISDSVGARGGADIHLSPDGCYLYSSNRLKAEGIAIFAVYKESGLLTRIGYQPTSAHPRQFNITPNGKYLLCCCRDDDKIQVFRRDEKTGLLTDTCQDITVSRAVCIQFTDMLDGQ